MKKIIAVEVSTGFRTEETASIVNRMSFLRLAESLQRSGDIRPSETLLQVSIIDDGDGRHALLLHYGSRKQEQGR